MTMQKIVILGGGYAGILTAKQLTKELTKEEAEIILINQQQYHYITTEIHQPAAGALPIEKTKIEYSDMLDMSRITLKVGKVTEIDRKQKCVKIADEVIEYNYLAIALGAEIETYGVSGVKENTFYEWNYDFARKVNDAIECELKYKRPHKPIQLVVIGGGFTGVEMAGELADRIPSLCKKYNLTKDQIRVVLIEASGQLLAGFSDDLADYARESLEHKGVEVRLQSPVKSCEHGSVVLKNGERLNSNVVIWAAGVTGNELVKQLGFPCKNGRVNVDHTLRPKNENVYVIGDSAIFREGYKEYPPTAQIAMQMGTQVGKNIASTIKGKEVGVFKPSIKGVMASIGRRDAVGVVAGIKIKGAIGSILKRVIDLKYLLVVGGVKLAIKKGRLI